MKNLLSIILLLAAFTLGYIVAPANTVTPAVSECDCAGSLPSGQNMTVAHDYSADLLAANKKLKRLEELNKSLAVQLEHLNLPGITPVNYPDLLKKIDRLPDAFIKEQMAYLFDDEFIGQIKDHKGFSKRLIEVALSDDGGNVGDASVVFSLSPVSGNSLISGSVNLNKSDTVFAHIETTGNIDKVIVKWKKTETGQVLLIKQFSLLAGGDSRYVWLQPSAGWQPGNYSVNVYTMDESMTAVGGSSFSVASVDASDTSQQDIDQELLSTGQAVPRITH